MSLASEAAQPFDGVKIVPGFADTYPNVKIGAVSQPAAWADTIYAGPDEPILIAQLVRRDAPVQNVVVGRVGGSGPREATVAAAPGGSDTITITDANGVAYTATFLTSYTPTVGDRVRVLWQGRDATVIGKVGVTPAPAASATATAPPPPPPSTGTLSVACTDSGTYSGGAIGWNSYYGQNLYQGNGSVWGAPGSNTGAWFYSGFSPAAGATITRVQLRLPARKTAGYYNSAATAHVYAHTSTDRPGGNVSLAGGPYDFSIPAGFGGGWVDLPVGVAATLVAGGGLAISGDPYMGFVGKADDPASGQVLMDWSR